MAAIVVASHGNGALQRQCINPSSDLEIQLRAIWSDILGTTAFGIADDFFALGGNSLSAARLALRLQNDLGVDVALGTIFHCLTIRALTAFCADADPPSHRFVRDTAIPAVQPIDLDSV